MGAAVDEVSTLFGGVGLGGGPRWELRAARWHRGPGVVGGTTSGLIFRGFFSRMRGRSGGFSSLASSEKSMTCTGPSEISSHGFIHGFFPGIRLVDRRNLGPLDTLGQFATGLQLGVGRGRRCRWLRGGSPWSGSEGSSSLACSTREGMTGESVGSAGTGAGLRRHNRRTWRHGRGRRFGLIALTHDIVGHPLKCQIRQVSGGPDLGRKISLFGLVELGSRLGRGATGRRALPGQPHQRRPAPQGPMPWRRWKEHAPERCARMAAKRSNRRAERTTGAGAHSRSIELIDTVGPLATLGPLLWMAAWISAGARRASS